MKDEKAWEDYRSSREWWTLKYKALRVAGGQCQGTVNGQRCKRTSSLEMHHTAYTFGPDDDCMENVCILCRECHERTTNSGCLSLWVPA